MENNKNKIFYKPIRLKECSFFLKRNNLGYTRTIISVPKYIEKHSSRRNYLKRIVKYSIKNSKLRNLSLDIIFFLNKKMRFKNDIYYTINRIWNNLF